MKVVVKSASSTVVTRSAAKLHGGRLGAEAAAGDFVAVSSCGDELPWAIGEVTAEIRDYEGDIVVGTDGSDIKPSDAAIQLRRWLPLEAGGGGSLHEASDDVIPALASSILVRISAAEAQAMAQARAQALRYSEYASAFDRADARRGRFIRCVRAAGAEPAAA